MTQTPGTNSDRQLVVFENNPTNPDYQRLVAIPPDQAKGIGLPALTVGTPVPTIGTTQGEGFYDRATGMAYVWDGAVWQPITPRAEIEPWVPTKPYVEHEVVEHNDVLWIAVNSVPLNSEPVSPSIHWRPLSTTGMVSVPSACGADGLDNIPKINGAHAITQDTGQIYTLIEQGPDRIWVELYGAVIEQAIGSNAPTGDIFGEIKMFAVQVPMLPTGWVVCDGSPIDPALTTAITVIGVNVPDLRDQFIRGSSATVLPGTTAGATTGAPTSGLSVSASTDGNHTHNRLVGNGNDSVDWSISPGTSPTGQGNWSAQAAAHEKSGYISNAGDHTHTMTASGWDTETAPQHYRMLFAIYVGTAGTQDEGDGEGPIEEDNYTIVNVDVLNTDASVYGSNSPGEYDTNGLWTGWMYQNSGSGDKINWRLFTQDANTVNPYILGDVESLFMVLRDVHASLSEVPRITVYTIPQNDGNDATATYRSRVTYEYLNPDPGLSSGGSAFMVWSIVEPSDYGSSLSKAEAPLSAYLTTGPQDAAEVIQSIVVQTEGVTSPNVYNFAFDALGVQFSDFNTYVFNTVAVAPTINYPIALQGYYPLYADVVESNAAGNGSSHTHTFNGTVYFMPNGIDIYHGNYPPALGTPTIATDTTNPSQTETATVSWDGTEFASYTTIQWGSSVPNDVIADPTASITLVTYDPTVAGDHILTALLTSPNATDSPQTATIAVPVLPELAVDFEIIQDNGFTSDAKIWVGNWGPYWSGNGIADAPTGWSVTITSVNQLDFPNTDELTTAETDNGDGTWTYVITAGTNHYGPLALDVWLEEYITVLGPLANSPNTQPGDVITGISGGVFYFS